MEDLIEEMVDRLDKLLRTKEGCKLAPLERQTLYTFGLACVQQWEILQEEKRVTAEEQRLLKKCPAIGGIQ